ncbi:MAG: hypothetical protein JSV88_16745 [Candidatus Aminicenantes bacterium]|nr:MAG: hypothetical protein JSV88_16745 [Candidatus Aminicenantes bacterium]
MNYHQLTIEIDLDGLKKIQEFQQSVAIVRSFKGFDPSKEHPVVCIAFEPFWQYNIIKFTTDWKMVVSTQSIKEYNTVLVQCETISPVSVGYTYTYNGVSFDEGRKGLPSQYGLDNQHDKKETITVGMSQKVISPNEDEQFRQTNAAAVPFDNIIYFEPLEKIKVFLANNMKNGLILPPNILIPNTDRRPISGPLEIVIGRYLEVNLTDKETIIHYDNKNNTFALGPLPA